MQWLEREFVPIAAASEVTQAPVRRFVGGQALVLARADDGAPFALGDLCPHRGAPLSAGKVRAGEIECPYHGILFGRDGRATSVPWSPEECRLRTPSYAVLEQDGILFVSRSTEPVAPPRLAKPKGWRRIEQQMAIDAPFAEVVENFMDSTHTGLVHTGLIRSCAARRPRSVSITSSERQVIVEHEPTDEDLGIARRWLGPGAIAHRDTCHVPGTVEVQYSVDGAPFFRALVFVAPRTDATSEVFVRAAFSSVRTGARVGDWCRALADRGAAWILPSIAKRVLRQDRAILEATEESVARASRRPRAYLEGEAMHRFVHGLLEGKPQIGEAKVTLVL